MLCGRTDRGIERAVLDSCTSGVAHGLMAGSLTTVRMVPTVKVSDVVRGAGDLRRPRLVLFALAAALSSIGVAPVGPSTAVAPQCGGEDPTIVGTPADETIRGTSGPDVIVGGGGSDTIFGYGGADRICVQPSGAEIDRPTPKIYGGEGDDLLEGGAVLYAGGEGADTLIATCYADCQVAVLVGGQGNDRLQSVGGDFFKPGPGNDTVVGDPDDPNGWISFRGARHGVVVDLSAGTAVGQGRDVLHWIGTVTGSDHADIVVGTAADDGFYGRGGNDVFLGRGGRDFAIGGDGDDSLSGGTGRDYLAGGYGRDAVFGRGGNDQIQERRPGPNLILGGVGRDNCFGSYRVPPSIERGCETHRTPQFGGDRTLPARS